MAGRRLPVLADKSPAHPVLRLQVALDDALRLHPDGRPVWHRLLPVLEAAEVMEDLPPICIDFETFYDTKSGCSVKPLGAEAYCRHPDFYAFLVAVYDGTTLWVGDPAD